MIKWGENLSDEEIEEKVIEIAAEVLGRSKEGITRETSFIGDLDADSLNTVYLVTEFEEEFLLSIPDEKVDELQTIGRVVDYAKNGLAERPAPYFADD